MSTWFLGANISLNTQSSQGRHFWNKDYVYVLRSEWMPVPPPHTQIHAEILMPSDGIKKWGFCQVLRSWGGSPLNGMSACIKEMPQSSWVPPPKFLPPLEDTTRSLQPTEGLHPVMLAPWSWTCSFQNYEKKKILFISYPRRSSPENAGPLILDLLFPELWESKYLLFISHPVCAILLEQTKETKRMWKTGKIKYCQHFSCPFLSFVFRERLPGVILILKNVIFFLN